MKVDDIDHIYRDGRHDEWRTAWLLDFGWTLG